MVRRFKIGDKVRILDCEYARNAGIISFEGVIDEYKDGSDYHYNVSLLGETDIVGDKYALLADNELVLFADIVIKKEHPYISYNPTFNLEVLQLGSLIHINKGYLNLQGILTKVSLTELTIAYYDYESSSKVSRETVNIKDIINGQQSFEIIREAISN